MGKLTGGSSSQTTTSSPWEPAQDILKKLLGDAGKLYDEQGGINAEFINKEIADLTPEMQEAVKGLLNSQGMKDMVNSMQSDIKTGVSGIGQATGILGGLTQQGITGEDINKLAGELYDSDTVKSQKESLTKTVQEGLDKNIQGLNQQASSSGGMGSSRAGVAEGVAVGEAADAIAQGSASIENAARQQAYGQALSTLQGNQSTSLGAAGQLGQLGLGSGNLGMSSSQVQNQILQNQLQGAGILQNQNQNILNNNWFNQTGQQQAGWNNINQLLGVAGSIGGMGGSTTTSGGTSGGASGLGGLLTGIGAVGSLFKPSDTTLKKNVKRKKDKTKTGQAEYSWEWNESAKKAVGKSGKESGVLAQQVAKETPEAVSKDKKTGRLMVDYDKI